MKLTYTFKRWEFVFEDDSVKIVPPDGNKGINFDAKEFEKLSGMNGIINEDHID